MLPGLRFGPPLKAGAAIGVAYGNQLGRIQFAGPIALGEVGLGGGRASVGYFFAGPFASGIEVLGSAIRTWGSPSQVRKDQTLVGGEIRASFFLVNVGVGRYKTPREGEEKNVRWFLNVGLGI